MKAGVVYPQIELGGDTGAVKAFAQAAEDLAARAARALDAEPAGRGYSPMASDLSAGKIVLFGGTSLDAHLSDTWVYDYYMYGFIRETD